MQPKRELLMSKASKRLLIIDPVVSRTSPSMRAVVASLPELRRQGWWVEIWTWQLDEGIEADQVVILNTLGNVHTFGFHAFTFWCGRRWKQVQQQGESYDLVYSVAWYFAGCDVLHVHFSAFDWERRQRLLGIRSLRDAFERSVNLISLGRARQFLSSTRANLVISVSESVKRDLQEVAPRLNYEVLGNCYLPQQFHRGLRGEVRDTQRGKLGYDSTDLVFVFASAGHYRRKGFPLAFHAVAKLRERHPQVKLLVVGGTDKRLAGLKTWCARQRSDYASWVQFTGMVSDIQNYFAASDGFLFPSYSEAFALVEIEAAATGLPLFLTPHHGSEMILEEGINGLTLPFDAEGIAQVLERFVTQAWQPDLERSSMKHAIDQATYTARFCELLEQARISKSQSVVDV